MTKEQFLRPGESLAQKDPKINSYFHFEDYESAGKKVFYGLHWREYTPPELRALFANAGFDVLTCHSVAVFHNFERVGPVRRLARHLSTLGSMAFPRFGTNVYLSARKL